MSMTKGERDDLIRLARTRAKLAKVKAKEREKILAAEAEELLAAEYSAQDALWAQAVALAQEACRKANDQIAAECMALGIPPQAVPSLDLSWNRRGQYATSQARSEARSLADKRLSAMSAVAASAIDTALLEIETQLIGGSLQSEDAVKFLDSMPAPDDLLPALTLDDLGVTTWQPPDGAAASLLSPMSATERKRRRIRQAIAANPGKSDRAIAKVAGVDHSTIAAYRKASGEATAITGGEVADSPADGEDGAA